MTFDIIAELRGEENYNHLGAIRAVGFSLMSLSMLGSVSIVFAAWTYRNRKQRVVQMVSITSSCSFIEYLIAHREELPTSNIIRVSHYLCTSFAVELS
jgi:cellobiose-specific phosphotransferase system component IIC